METLSHTAPLIEHWTVKRCRVSPAIARLIAELVGFKSGGVRQMNAGVRFPIQVAKLIPRLTSDHKGEVVAAFTAEGVPILRLEEAA